MTDNDSGPPNESVFEQFDVSEVVNAAGTKTRVGGTRMRSEAADAMRAAANGFVRISDLQAEASKRIAEATNADAGYVTTGASAALTMAAAACIAGDDLGVMSRLPETEEIADEIVMPRSQRSAYDHALRLAGATIVDVGTLDRDLGSGSTNVKPWELADAIGEDTAAVACIATPEMNLSVDTVVSVAHSNDVPVIVDAAAELPPKENLSRFVDTGADLVAFSGGKAIRGPQATGILAGRQDLIRSVALQHLDMDIVEELWDPPAEFFSGVDLQGVPRHGIGRGMKVGREELTGILTALDAFLEEDDEDTFAEWDSRARSMAEQLQDLDGLEVSLAGTEKMERVTHVELRLKKDVIGFGTLELARQLQRHDPQIYVGYTGPPSAPIILNPMCLTSEEAEFVADVVANLVQPD